LTSEARKFRARESWGTGSRGTTNYRQGDQIGKKSLQENLKGRRGEGGVEYGEKMGGLRGMGSRTFLTAAKASGSKK